MFVTVSNTVKITLLLLLGCQVSTFCIDEVFTKKITNYTGLYMFAQEFFRVCDMETFQLLLETPWRPLKAAINLISRFGILIISVNVSRI